MALASLSDVQGFLPADKLSVTDPLIADWQTDADRIIKGYLYGIYDATVVAAWTSPTVTPDVIRAIAGRFVASKYYMMRYSEDSRDSPTYAQALYDEAMEMLRQLREGTLILAGVPDSTPQGLTVDDFWPNDDAPGPYFTMEQQL